MQTMKTLFTLSPAAAKASVLTAILLSLSACTSLGPDYQRPQLVQAAASASWQSPAAIARSDVAMLTWWRQFDDAVLDQLLAEAQQQNQDLLLAAARVEEARALAVGARASRYPSVDANLNASRNRLSETAGKVGEGRSPYGKDFQLGLSASYEVDFWGKLARADEAAKARFMASAYNQASVKTSLYSSVVQAYFNLRAADAQLDLAQQTLQSRQQHLALQQKRRQAGSIGDADLHLAESEVAATEATLAQAQLSQSNWESALSLLLGRAPAAIAQPQLARGKTMTQLFQRASLPADLNSDVVQRRPDLMAAEQGLIAANADIGQAKAQYFPSVKLTASTGYESNVFDNLLKPSSWLWNLGGNLLQPVFRAGAIDAVVAGAEARKQQASAQYVQAVQGAFRDVHDALSAVSANQQVYLANQKRVLALQDTQRIVQSRYQQGYSAYIEVLNAQRDLAQVQTGLIEAQRAQLSAIVNLYKALGGGWDQQVSLEKS